MSIVVPAILPTTRKDLEAKLASLAHIPSITRVQIDVVDGAFASPPSWPYVAPGELRDMVARGETLPRLNHVEYEIDLMCTDAEKVAGDWLALGASRLTFHAESTTDLRALLASMHRRYGSGEDFTSDLISFGVAIDFESDLTLIEPYLELVDYVQCMGIAQIGQQGQPFDPRVLEQVGTFHTKHPDKVVQVDGGITLPHAKELLKLGVSNLVIGSAILRASDPIAAVEAFEALQSPYGV